MTLTPAVWPDMHGMLERVSSAAAPYLSSDDLSVVKGLLADGGPHSLEGRSDLRMHGSRVVVRAAQGWALSEIHVRHQKGRVRATRHGHRNG